MNKHNHRQHKNTVHRRENINYEKIGPAQKFLKDIAEKSLHGNQECLIPATGNEVHSGMRNCHIIGKEFLGKIAISEKGNQILTWPASAMHIGNQVIVAIKSNDYKPQNTPIVKLQRFNPVEIGYNSKDCKYTIACGVHDDKPFEKIDTAANFNPCDQETRFKLGLRSIAAYAAWYQGHKRWIEYDFVNDPRTLMIIKEYPTSIGLVHQLIRNFYDYAKLEAALAE